MSDFFNYLQSMPVFDKVLWLFACLSLASVAETLWPMYKADNRRDNLLINMSLLVILSLVNAVISVAITLVTDAVTEHGFGLLQWLDPPVLLGFLLSILLLDLLGDYLAHYVTHHVPFLWRFHQVHHSDTEVNATTGARMHPVDYTFRELMSVAAIAVLGVPFAFYIFFRLTMVFFTYFNHANIEIPPKVDRLLSQWVVTPSMHKYHHHAYLPWTNRNFGNIFSFWDRLFGTLIATKDMQIEYGVDSMDPKQANVLRYQLSEPFRKANAPKP